MLVPFAQVVLLTAIEYLREEEVNSSGDKDETEAQGLETKVAWKLPVKKNSNAAYVQVLVVVGK